MSAGKFQAGMRGPRILFVVADPVSRGASSIRVRALLQCLAAKGYMIDLVTGAPLCSDDELRRMCRRLTEIPFVRHPSRVGWALQRLLSFPDIYGPWALRVVEHLASRAHSFDIDCVIVSSPPHGLQAVGSAAAARWGIPYVADLRDDWLGNHRVRWPTPVHRLVARRAESRMVINADLLVANTERMRAQLLERHPDIAHKVVVVTNGFDERHFSEVETPEVDPAVIRVGYLGSAYGGYVRRVLEAMAGHWRTRGKQEKWEIVAYTDDRRSIPSVPGIKAHGDLLAPPDAARVMLGCDVLLVLMPPGEREPSPTVPLKTYAYLKTGVSIVYCGERGATTELLAQFEGTWSVPRCGGDELAAFLESRRSEWKKRYDRKGIARFGFGEIGRVFEAHIRSVLSGGATRPRMYDQCGCGENRMGGSRHG